MELIAWQAANGSCHPPTVAPFVSFHPNSHVISAGKSCRLGPNSRAPIDTDGKVKRSQIINPKQRIFLRKTHVCHVLVRSTSFFHETRNDFRRLWVMGWWPKQRQYWMGLGWEWVHLGTWHMPILLNISTINVQSIIQYLFIFKIIYLKKKKSYKINYLSYHFPSVCAISNE